MLQRGLSLIQLRPLTLGDLGHGGDRAGTPATVYPELRGAAESRPAPSTAEVSALIDQSLRLVRRFGVVAPQVHGRRRLSGGRRGVLKELERSGPRTVPQLARARSVTRQHVQALVNPLEEEGLVEFAENPEHKRSRLVRLTDAGRAWLAEATERETLLLSRLELDVLDEELRVAAGILGAVSRALAKEAGPRPPRGEGTVRAS